MSKTFKAMVKVALRARMLRSELRLKKLQGCRVVTVEGDWQEARKEFERLYQAFKEKCRSHGLEIPDFTMDDLCNVLERL